MTTCDQAQLEARGTSTRPAALRCRRLLLGAVGLLTVSCAAPDPRPNVVVISIDTIRHDFLGSYGDPDGVTPVLDRLAADGVLFVQALSTTSWTLPSHMSLLTGQYPSSHGVTGDWRTLADDKTTLAEYLGQRGYATGAFVSGPYLHRAYGYGQGFDTYRHCVSYGEEIDEQGRVANLIGVNQRSHHGITSPTIHQATTAWLDEQPRGVPYFLFVHYWDPHYDFTPPSPYDRFLDPDYRGRLRGEGFLANAAIGPDMPEADRDRLLDLYRGEIRYTDAWIGRLFAHLEARGDLDRTIVIVTGDHGEEFFEHGDKGHRNNLYDETLRIPLIARLPGMFDGRRLVTAPVSLVDVFPSVAALVGSPPAEAQGVDLAAALEAAPPRAGVVAELHNRLVTLVGAEWKVILDLETGDEEVYSVRDDPGETRNESETQTDEVSKLRAVLETGEYARYAPEATDAPVLDEATEEALRALGYTK